MRPYLRNTLAILTVAAVTGGGLLLPVASASAAPVPAPAPKADFNGDGFADVVVGTPGAAVGEVRAAGQAVVLYGSGAGLAPAKRQLLTQDSPGVPGAPGAGDAFGSVSAVGDFDGDGFSDLAVTARGEYNNAGHLSVIWGSKNGLSSGVALADPDKLPVQTPQNRRIWGAKLVAGDFDGDGKDELVVGAAANAAVNGTLYTYENIARTGAQPAPVKTALGFRLTSSSEGIAAGDVNGDGHDDLVLAGTANSLNQYVPGSPAGLVPAAAKPVGPGDGQAVGDINGDGYGDIVIGNRYGAKGGQILVSYGSAAGPSATPVAIDQGTPGVPGADEQNDGFGVSLSFGDVDGDGYQDLAVGAYGEALDTVTPTGTTSVSVAGSVFLFRGSADGLVTKTGVQAMSRNSAGVPGDARRAEQFGVEVKLTDTNKDGKADLIVGASDADGVNAGSVTYLPSSGTKVGGTGSLQIVPAQVGLTPFGGLSFGAHFNH
ncbi:MULTISPECIES: FG-GAP-like repeat-containing protein [unclassified Streptomyces]|uniref:FG-GAP and VCBS repeat-containing protein n=1 Tax=unclassified Streptomyces TaxID=2593676 RepID=UPI000DC7682C|nr:MULTISPECIES: FG-GAP-like repeat-containing protein [unclassified Streptomyces]AWZ06791.1 hypothetical protein DRB89_21635 [Streptomyces sp. ICC4]AWZ16911.1 hypothetical protein DRB96_37385 [Streptomyces sp. ICC1]